MNFQQLHSSDPLTRGELTSITAVVEYLAYKKGSGSEKTYCRLAAEFDVAEVTQIKRRDYDRAMKFLIDLEGNENETGELSWS
jgi:hypothetical protein